MPTNEKVPPEYDPWVLNYHLYNAAERWWTISLALKIAYFVIGAVTVILPAIPPEPIPFILAFFFFLAEWNSYRSDDLKSTAQTLRRKLDMFDSFGWPIGDNEYADLLVRCPLSVKSAARNKQPKEPYFRSKAPQGADRVLENVRESAWWSKHLSEKMGNVCLMIMFSAVVISLAALIFTLVGVKNQASYAGVARVVTSLLMLILSLGLVRLMRGYYGFSKKAAETEQKVSRLLASGSIDLTEAIKAFYEYDVARTVAPIILNWIWRRNRDELNALYDKFFAKNA